MKVISDNEISNMTVLPKRFVEWVEKALLEKKDAILPPKISMKPADDIFYNVMPTILEKEDIAGVKVVNRYPERIPSLNSQILLYNRTSGDLLALMGGDYITKMRTGAVAVHTISVLAVKDFKTIAVIGLGNQARATIEILLNYYPEKIFEFKLMKHKEQHIEFGKFIKRLSCSNIKVSYCDSYDETVSDADVVISAITFTDSNLISSPDIFKPGVLLIPIHTRGFLNCDLTFDRIFGDDINHIKGFKYFNQFKSFAEIADVLSGNAIGRTNNQERIIAYNIGIALHDMYFANQFYKLCTN